MASVGHFGKLKFYSKLGEDGNPKIQSFTNMSWNISVNVAEHERHGKKPFLEVTSRNPDEINMTLCFRAELGVKPWVMLSRLRNYVLGSKVYPLVIGGKRFGSMKWLITDVSNDLKAFYIDGRLTGFDAQVTLKEYVYKKSKSKKKKTVKKSKSGKKAKKKIKSVKTKGYTTYTVKKGDTLWGLAVRFYGKGKGPKYVKIYNANKKASKGFHKISNPHKIMPGWVIKIPK